VKILDLREAEMLTKNDVNFFMPTEDVSFLIVEKFFSKKKVKFFQVFLRWHKDNVEEKKRVNSHKTISLSEFEREIMARLFKESEKSWDWWRQVGALIVKNKQLLLITHNKHTPHEQMPYAFGDPRSIFKKGIHIELSTANHAEASLIAEAAKQKNISLKDADLFVTDFPCPPCARLISGSGIKRCYFSRGYTILDGEDILKDAGVEIIFVKNP
jgi:dCMP deaminase